MQATAPLTVVLADDHRAFAEALAMRLATEPGVVLAGVTGFEDLDEAVATVAKADILVTDVEVGGVDALDLAARARRTNGDLGVVVLTSHEDPEVALRALRAGATSFMTKDATVQDVIGAIRGASRHEAWVAPRVLTGVLRELLGGARPPSTWEERVIALTARERQVLACMIAGMNRSTIASELFVSPNTVRTHTQRILAKLGVHSSLQAVSVARRAGVQAWGGPPPPARARRRSS